MKIKVNGRIINCEIERSQKRKTVKLWLITANQLKVIAPCRISYSELEKLIMSKADWLAGQLTKLASLSSNPINSAIVNGANILYLGRPHTLEIVHSPTTEVNLYPGRIVLKCPVISSDTPVQLLRSWYIAAAKTIFAEKTAYWSARLQLKPQRITIKDQRTRWGSCSSKGNINYNWRLVMAPPLIIDYLVIHELCHLAVPNHSAKYWELVQSVLPSYRNQRKWLKENGKLLSRIL